MKPTVLINMKTMQKSLKKKASIAVNSAILAVLTVGDIFSPTKHLPSEPIDVDPGEIRVWMVGHATVLINFFGTTILTDPVLVYGFPLPKRHVLHGYKARELPPLDYVIISHAHFDHFDKRTLRKLANKTKNLIIPRNCKDLVEKMPFQNVIELDWQDEFNPGDLKITSYNPVHWGKRVPWEKKNRGFNCYVLEKNGRTIFFGGDTAYGSFFKEIGKKHRIDIALLPISAYRSALMGSHHMNPHEAHEAFSDLKSSHCIPIHWGSFRLTLEAMDEPPELFRYRAELDGISDRTHILPNGKSFLFNLESEMNLAPEYATETVENN